VTATQVRNGVPKPLAFALSVAPERTGAYAPSCTMRFSQYVAGIYTESRIICM